MVTAWRCLLCLAHPRWRRYRACACTARRRRVYASHLLFRYGETCLMHAGGICLLNRCVRAGWVAYSVSALVSSVGENKLMSIDPDCKSKIFNGISGHGRENSSWILGRIVRDFGAWCHADTKRKTAEVLNEKWKQLKKKNPAAKKPVIAGLVVSIYSPSRTIPAGVPRLDFVYQSGVA